MLRISTIVFPKICANNSKVPINPVQDRGWSGGGQKDPPTNFFLVTSTNVGTSPKNFLTFTFNPFATLV